MTSIDTIVSVHPIVILSISEFYNRMKMNFGSRRVFGGLIGEILGKKVELHSNFEFLDKGYSNSDNSFVDLDLEFLEERKRILEQLYATYDFLGFFSITKTDVPDKQDAEVAKRLIDYGIINPICLVLSNELLDKEELPMKVYIYNKELCTFTLIKHEIVGLDSERICLDTVTKSGGVQNNDTQLIQNMDTLKSALSMLKSNLISALSKSEKIENRSNLHFVEMLNDILSNHPNSSDPGLKDLIDNSMEDMLIINNIISSSIGVNYSTKA